MGLQLFLSAERGRGAGGLLVFFALGQPAHSGRRGAAGEDASCEGVEIVAAAVDAVVGEEVDPGRACLSY